MNPDYVGQQCCFIKNVFSIGAPSIDILTKTFSFGLDYVWRKRLISLSGIKDGDRVLDVCTGTGEMAILLSKRLGTKGSVIGIDFCEEMLTIARKKINAHSGNISFVFSDARAIVFHDNTFDAVTVAFGIRNISDTIRVLKEISRVLKPGGRFLCLELTRPQNQWLLPLYKCYVFRVIPFVGRIVTKSAIPYSHLARSIDAFYPLEEFSHIIEDCGFSNVVVHPVTMGVATIYEAIKSGQSQHPVQ